MRLIPGPATKIPHAVWYGKKPPKNQKTKNNKTKQKQKQKQTQGSLSGAPATSISEKGAQGPFLYLLQASLCSQILLYKMAGS